LSSHADSLLFFSSFWDCCCFSAFLGVQLQLLFHTFHALYRGDFPVFMRASHARCGGFPGGASFL